jgi:HK97 family phage prohead protease
MPYFISSDNPECSGWAVEKQDGEVLGCHQSKEDAIKQMVALSIAEDIEPGGERKYKKKYKRDNSYPLAVISDIDGILIVDDQRDEKAYAYLADMEDTRIILVTARLEGERDRTETQLAELGIEYDDIFFKANDEVDTVQYKYAVARDLLETYNIIIGIDDRADVRESYRELGITALGLDEIPETPETNLREVNLKPPSYMRAAARRGLELNRQGKSGQGLTEKTVREAREMAAGRVSKDKWVRIAAWIARHLVDLDSPKNSNPQDPGYPGPGLVAHLLWGSGPSKSAAQRTLKYAEGVVERIRAEENRAKWSSVDIQLKKEKDQPVNKVERRIKNDIDFEIRMDSADVDGMRFSGYAAVFNSDSEPLPFTERILPGAFSKTLRSRNEIKLFKNHNMDEVLASTRSKTLKLKEDGSGLLAEAVLPDTTAGRDLAVLMKRGDVHSMSFGFSVPNGGDSWNNKGTVRELREVRLHEVSIVTGFPAYEATTASVRSLEVLATRTEVDVDKIADVLVKLESGETLPADEADLLIEVVEKLKENKEELQDDLTNLNLKRKELDLLFKAV